ncbi:MAG: copper chaperone PCu(A)C [Deltaproteobacteria bacterium]|nr:copper chaperone PCu(A)C [Deltaproteobacteria bacterium]
MYRSVLRFTVILAATLPLPTLAANTDLVIQDPYVRLAPPNAPATGAFMVIKNSANTDRKLITAESTAAKTVELHNHINDNGVMKMRQVPSIDIKANGQAELKPGSYHVMLINMTQPLKEGDSVPITLNFDDGSKQQINAPVRKMQMTPPADKAGTHEGMKH